MNKIYMEQRENRDLDLIKFYSFKRTILFFDEWGFYILLLTLYRYSFPFWLIFSILFYGGGAIYTSYVNLNKIESEIVNVDQEIYVFKDLISKLYELNIETLKKSFGIICDYFHMRPQVVNESIAIQASREESNDMIVEDINESNESISKDE